MCVCTLRVRMEGNGGVALGILGRRQAGDLAVLPGQ